MQKRKTEITEDRNIESREIWLDDNMISEISNDSSDDANEIINDNEDEE